MTGTQLFREATGIAFKTLPVEERCECRFCGKIMEPGDQGAVSELSPGSFTDFQDVFSPETQGPVCPDCFPLVGAGCKVNLMKTGKALISKEGVFATRSHAHRASVILDPNVSAPFVWVMTPLATKMRHMLWRTPVSRSRDFIYLYLNDQVTTIRRPFVVDCYRHLQTLERPANAKKIHQFMLSGDPDFREPEIGRMRGDLRKLFPSVSGLIGEMTLGEIWALNSLLLRGEVPEQPPRVDF